MADIFDELNEDLRAERTRALARRYGVLVGAGILALVVGIGGWQGYVAWQDRRAQQVALPYLQAMRAADALPTGPDPARLTVADSFAALSKDAPAGYRTLARLREAALRWDAGDTGAAFLLWDTISNDNSADPLLRDLATLLWAQHAIDKGDPAAITARTAKLETASNPWKPLAVEVDAELALRLDDRDRAATLLRSLLTDALATDGLRERAGQLLAAMGAGSAARG